jgi:hypothetical protein
MEEAQDIDLGIRRTPSQMTESMRNNEHELKLKFPRAMQVLKLKDFVILESNRDFHSRAARYV